MHFRPRRADRHLAVASLVAAAIAVAATSGAGTSRQCTDPCLQAARAETKDCTSSASGAFQDGLDACLERDGQCVAACRAVQQDCRDATSVGADLAACAAGLTGAKRECARRFPVGSLRHVACLYRAQVATFRCRRAAFADARRERRACRTQFRACVDGCGPGGPPGGASACHAQAKDEFHAVVAGCRQVHRVSASACLGTDLECTLACTDARETCSAPTRSQLDAAIASCRATAVAAVATCAALPGGSPEFNQCIQSAQASFTACRDAALDAASPGLAACLAQYVGCVRACPAA